MAEYFEDAKLVSEHREYVIYTGKTNGIDVTVCSTGIGSPSAAIALEELIRVGANTFIRVGSSGGRQPDIPIGTLIVVTAAYRGDGTSQEYMPLGFPAVADLTVSNALLEAAQSLDYPHHYGIGTTRDAFYVRDNILNEKLKDAGVVAAEMEAATLFIAGSVRHVRVGCVVATDSNIWLDKQPSLEEKEALYYEGEKKTIVAALKAIQILDSQRTD
ncbi:MAG: nucleoside phosphorylase [Anaerolineae bacterium]|nr:nucleoside phosphorylase [Anaerolineae bacterium]